mmetsp:Transcript_27600/g.40771  ORF Transcript_27600/g.40771 Transcript_27600/m.40771 type:complete len:80 (-) Transcript_27600:62-301(-)
MGLFWSLKTDVKKWMNFMKLVTNYFPRNPVLVERLKCNFLNVDANKKLHKANVKVVAQGCSVIKLECNNRQIKTLFNVI